MLSPQDQSEYLIPGYGGLTILDKIRELLPQYDYIYLGTMPVPHTEQGRFKLGVYEFTL